MLCGGRSGDPLQKPQSDLANQHVRNKRKTGRPLFGGGDEDGMGEPKRCAAGLPRRVFTASFPGTDIATSGGMNNLATPLSNAIWIALLLTIASATPARAQYDSRADASVGYSAMRDYDGEVTFPRGWFATVGANVAGPVALIGDVSGSHKSMGGFNVNVGVRLYTFMGGARAQWHRGRLGPYAQMLVGVARMSTTFKLPDETLSDVRHHFAMSPGAGLDFQLTSRAAVRGGASLRLLRSEMATPVGSESFTFRELQAIAGVVIR
jgi:outer membrane protein with beta-barrel domain